jgi:hypothetical protein
MKRRTEPVKGFDAAIPVALRRGRVMHFRLSPAYVSEFLFYGNGLLVLVSLRLARRLFHATPARISEEYTDAIAGLCTVPCGGPVSRELWLYSRYGALRFFRVRVDGSLEEIDRDGVPFVDGKPVVASPPVPGDAGALEPAPAAGIPAGSGSTDPPNPIIRWLKKRNAVKKSGAEGTGTTGAVEPGNIPDAESRGPAADMRVPADPPVSPPDSTPAAAEPVGVPVAVSLPREPGSSPATEEEGGGAGG